MTRCEGTSCEDVVRFRSTSSWKDFDATEFGTRSVREWPVLASASTRFGFLMRRKQERFLRSLFSMSSFRSFSRTRISKRVRILYYMAEPVALAFEHRAIVALAFVIASVM